MWYAYLYQEKKQERNYFKKERSFRYLFTFKQLICCVSGDKDSFEIGHRFFKLEDDAFHRVSTGCVAIKSTVFVGRASFTGERAAAALNDGGENGVCIKEGGRPWTGKWRPVKWTAWKGALLSRLLAFGFLLFNERFLSRSTPRQRPAFHRRDVTWKENRCFYHLPDWNIFHGFEYFPRGNKMDRSLVNFF